MRIGEDHSELVADGDTLDHVSDGAANGSNGCVSLLLLEPDSEFECVFVGFGFSLEDFDGDVSEALLEGA